MKIYQTTIHFFKRKSREKTITKNQGKSLVSILLVHSIDQADSLTLQFYSKAPAYHLAS